MAKVKETVWRDLTGQSDRWVRTLLLGVIVGRLSLLVIGVGVLMAFGGGALEGFSGLIEIPDLEWMFFGLLFAPIVESLGIRLAVWVLGSRIGWGWPVWATALICAALAIPLHGLTPLSFAVAPFFALMASVQHNWMNKGRAWAGFWLIVVIHAVANGAAIGAMILLG